MNVLPRVQTGRLQSSKLTQTNQRDCRWSISELQILVAAIKLLRLKLGKFVLAENQIVDGERCQSFLRLMNTTFYIKLTQYCQLCSTILLYLYHHHIAAEVVTSYKEFINHKSLLSLSTLTSDIKTGLTFDRSSVYSFTNNKM